MDDFIQSLPPLGPHYLFYFNAHYDVVNAGGHLPYSAWVVKPRHYNEEWESLGLGLEYAYPGDPVTRIIDWDVSMTSIQPWHQPFFDKHVNPMTMTTGADYRGTLWEPWLYSEENAGPEFPINIKMRGEVGIGLF